jgi:hypothetical protein
MTGPEAAGLGIGVLAIIAAEWLPRMPAWSKYGLTIIGFLLLAYSGVAFVEGATGMKLKLGPLALIAGGFLLVVAGVVWHIYAGTSAPPETSSSSVTESPRRPLTMREIFDSDFEGVAKIFTIQKIALPSENISFPVIEYIDIPTNSYFFAFYIDEKQPTLVMAEAILLSLDAIRNNLDQVVFEVITPGSTRVLKNSTMNFSRQVYLYFDKPINAAERYSIEQLYTGLGREVTIYDYSYHMLHWKEFERAPHSAEDAKGLGVQLPKAAIGASIRVTNNSGTLPPFTTIDPASPPPTGPVLLHHYADPQDRLGAAAKLRALYAILSEGIMPAQLKIHHILSDADAQVGTADLALTAQSIASLHDQLAALRQKIEADFVPGNLYSDEVWDVLGNKDPLNADMVALGAYLDALRTNPTAEQKRLLSPTLNAARQANLDAGNWASQCIVRARAKLDALDQL